MTKSMRAWLSRLVVVIAALASIATSRKKWELEAKAPANATLESPADGSAGLRATIEASGTPEAMCVLPSGSQRNVRPDYEGAVGTPGALTFFCPPGGKLAHVQLHGHLSGGMCSNSDDNAPDDQFVRITKTELVPTWRADVEETFTVSSGRDVSFHVESPRIAFVTASLEANETGLVVEDGFAFDDFVLKLAGATGSNARTATAHVKAHVFGPCAPDCAKPAAEQLKIERTE